MTERAEDIAVRGQTARQSCLRCKSRRSSQISERVYQHSDRWNAHRRISNDGYERQEDFDVDDRAQSGTSAGSPEVM